jgi:hypothetical protein
MEKGGAKNSTPIKPPESSTMTHEESEDIHNQLSNLENQFKELSDRSVTNVDLVNTQRQIEINMENMDQRWNIWNRKMDQKMEYMEQKMVARLIQTLDERLPKSDNVTEGTHENKGSIHVEQPSINKHIPGGFNSNIGANHGWVPKGIHFPKVELRKFDGTYVFTWVNQIEQYFELHNIMDDKQMISLATLYFETKPYQWYQWVVKRKPHSYHYTWGLFTRDLEAQYGKVWEQDYFS